MYICVCLYTGALGRCFTLQESEQALLHKLNGDKHMHCIKNTRLHIRAWRYSATFSNMSQPLEQPVTEYNHKDKLSYSTLTEHFR